MDYIKPYLLLKEQKWSLNYRLLVELYTKG